MSINLNNLGIDWEEIRNSFQEVENDSSKTLADVFKNKLESAKKSLNSERVTFQGRVIRFLSFFKFLSPLLNILKNKYETFRSSSERIDLASKKIEKYERA